jgi:hypothetical protein
MDVENKACILKINEENIIQRLFSEIKTLPTILCIHFWLVSVTALKLFFVMVLCKVSV